MQVCFSPAKVGASSALWRALIISLMAFLTACGGGSTSSGSSKKITILSEPADLVVFEDDPIELAVVAKSDYSLSYQWYRNGTSISTARDATLRITRARLSDAGTYQVEVDGFFNTVWSREVTVVVQERPVPPSITTQPVSQQRALRDSARFSVTAKGLSPLSYQWFHDGELIPGATSATLTVANLDYDNAGAYTVEVTNSLGMAASQEAELEVVSQRATGVWFGLVENDSKADMIVVPDGSMLLMQFGGDVHPLQGLYLGRVYTRDGISASSRGQIYTIPRVEDRMQFFGPDYEGGNYFLRLRDTWSEFYYRDRVEIDLDLYENFADLGPVSSPQHSFAGRYQAAASERDTPLDSLAATWLYFDEGDQPQVSITLNTEGQIQSGSFNGRNCSLRGQLEKLEGSTALFQATLTYANRSGRTCPSRGFTYQGYAFINPGVDGDSLLWYLYIKSGDDIVGFQYLPLKQ